MVPELPSGSGETSWTVGGIAGALTVREKDFGPSLPALFVAVTVKLNVPAVGDAHVNAPVVELSAEPDGMPEPLHVGAGVPIAVKLNE